MHGTHLLAPRGPIPIAPDRPGAPRLALLRDPDPARLRQRARAWGAHLRDGTLSRSYAGEYALVGWHRDQVGVAIHKVDAGDDRVASRSAETALANALGDTVPAAIRGELGSPADWPARRNGPWRARALTPVDGYCAWVCWREDGDQSPR